MAISLLCSLLSFYFAVTLLVAGFAKLDELSYFRAQLRAMRFLPSRSVEATSILIPSAEVVLAVSLVAGVEPWLVTWVNAGVFFGFLGLKVLIYVRRLPADCGCFGSLVCLHADKVGLTVSGIHALLALVLPILTTQTEPQLYASDAVLLLLLLSLSILFGCHILRRYVRSHVILRR